MSFYIVIRKQRETDTPQISEVVRHAYATNITNIFIGSLFNEATIHLIVIAAAIMFIFLQIPLVYCVLSIPVIFLFIYIFAYGAITMKSAQIMYEKKAIIGWVAEAYEPPALSYNPQNERFIIVSEDEDVEIKGRKQIIGTVALSRHLHHPEWSWIYRLTVDNRYRRKGIALALVNTAKNWCKNNQINRVELAMSEYNQGARQLFDKAGFNVKQLYHKRIISSFYMLQMSLLSAEVRPTF